MKYKIYEMLIKEVPGDEDLLSCFREPTKYELTEVKCFGKNIFNTIEDAYNELEKRGKKYGHYTILPYINFND